MESQAVASSSRPTPEASCRCGRMSRYHGSGRGCTRHPKLVRRHLRVRGCHRGLRATRPVCYLERSRFENIAERKLRPRQLTENGTAGERVLSPHGFCRLCFSLGIKGLVPAVPRKSLCPTHAPFTPTAVRPVIRLPTDLSQKIDSPLVSTAPCILSTRHRKVCFRSSFGHSPAQVLP
jgi:hypothetical protein